MLTPMNSFLLLGAVPSVLAVAEMGDRFATTDMGQKVGGGLGPFLGGAGSPI